MEVNALGAYEGPGRIQGPGFWVLQMVSSTIPTTPSPGPELLNPIAENPCVWGTDCRSDCSRRARGKPCSLVLW